MVTLTPRSSSLRIPPALRRRRATRRHLHQDADRRTPSEILGDLGFDFVVIDEEHAPFDRLSIDTALLAARASGTDGIVRVASPTAAKPVVGIGLRRHRRAGAACSSAAKAREIVAACRYRGGTARIFRLAACGPLRRQPDVGPRRGIGRGDDRHAMIEDPETLDEIDAIAAVEGARRLLHRPRRSHDGVRRAVERRARRFRPPTSALRRPRAPSASRYA